MKKALLIINDKTGNGRNGASTFKLTKSLSASGYMTTVYPISEEIDLDLSEYLQEGNYDRVVCMGGDGTLNRTINEVMKLEKRPTIGYIPAGTTNDFSKNLNLTGNIDKASQIISGDKIISYDVGLFNDCYFNYVAFFGAFSDISYSTEQKFKNVFGYVAYLLNGISSISENLSSHCHLKIKTDRESFEGDYLFGAICNSLSVAGIKLSNLTDEDLHDGLFELIMIKKPKNSSELGEIALALLNNNFESPYIEYHKIKSAEITTFEKTEWTLDGEYGGHPDIISFSIIKDAINICI